MPPYLRQIYVFALLLAAAAVAWIGFAGEHAGTGVVVGDGEVRVTFDTEPGTLYRLEVSTDLEAWQPLRTVAADGSPIELVEPVADGGRRRFFRAVALEAGSGLTGDYLATATGAVLIHPIDHASFVMQWEGKTIYNDPVGSAAAYAGIPPADLILIGHRHGDHFSASTIDAVRKAGTRIVAPQDVFDRMTTAHKALTTVLANGGSADLLGLSVAALPAYNANHPLGRDNGYIITVGERRIYMSGDTADIAEMRALRDIDVAFVSMNVPFTMDINAAASATREFRPGVIYPYHYRNQDGSFADLEAFRVLVGGDVGVEVRVRDWY